MAEKPVENLYTRKEKVVPVFIEQEMKKSYLSYAMSVIVGRALPDVRDGLKPVHRRILYAMKELGLYYNKPYRKCAKIVGDVLGKYHPHGDTAVYDTLVRMVQDFSLRYPLIDGQGNFGCFTADTKIKLLDGRELSFEQLANEYGPERHFYVYSVNQEGKITVGKANNPRVTRRQAQIMELVLDSGEKIRCTPDHRFMLRDGTYKEAQHLDDQDSLMAGYFKMSPVKEGLNEYLMVKQPAGGVYEFVHQMVDNWKQTKGIVPRAKGAFVRHHRNFNRFDNTPENIQRMGFLEHLHVHMGQIGVLWKDDAFRARQREGVKKFYKENPGVVEKRRQNFVEQNQSSTFRTTNGPKVAARLRRRFLENPHLAGEISQRMRKLWEDPDYRTKMSQALRGIEKRPLSPEQLARVKKIISEKSRVMWNSSKRAEIMQAMRLALSSPEIRKKISANSKKLWKDPAYRAKFGKNHFSRMAKELWKLPTTRELHRKTNERLWMDASFRQAHREGVRRSNLRRIAKDPTMMKNITSQAGAALRKLWKTEAHRNSVMRSRILRHGAYLLTRFSREEITSDVYDRHRSNNCFPRSGSVKKYFSSMEEMLKEASTYNHRVVSKQWLEERTDVWDITVEEYHNFLLSSNVFVHNSVDGDSAASMRYTEARLASISDEMLADIDKKTVNFTPNYDESEEEPTLLPAALPNLLCNGSSGIAVGMATNIPPHNLNEVADAIVAVMDNPEIPIKDIMKIIKGPDFPTGAIICGSEGFKSAYETGRGIVKIRAKAGVEEIKSGKQAIVVSEIPYQVNKSNLIENIASLVNDKKIEGISDVRDESDKDGMRLVIDLKRDANAQVILNLLFKHTQMQETFGIIFLALVDGSPRVLKLKEILNEYIRHRKEIIVRRTQFDLEKAKDRAHIVEGLKKAVDILDKIIKTIRKSKNPAEAKVALVESYDFSEKQAQAILEMQLQKLTGLEIHKLEEEYSELIKRIEYLESILKSEKKVLEIIKEELGKLKEKFGDERRTEISRSTDTDFNIEDLIADEDVVVTISHQGYVKRLPVSTYRKQKRGGVGVGSGGVEEDFVEHLFIASTHDNLLLFTSRGKAFTLKVHEIPQASRISKGKFIANFISLAQGEKVTSYIPVRDFKEGQFLVMTTRLGQIKKCDLTDFENTRRGGIIAVGLDPKDELIACELTDGKQEIFLATRKGKAIRFPENLVRSMGRNAGGVRGINLAPKDDVIGMEVVDKDATLLSVTEKGFGKRSKVNEYRVTSRGGKGVTNIKVTDKNGEVVGLRCVTDKDDIMIMTKEGMVVRCSVKDIRETGRVAQGVRLINLKKANDRVTTVAEVEPEEGTGIPEAAVDNKSSKPESKK